MNHNEIMKRIEEIREEVQKETDDLREAIWIKWRKIDKLLMGLNNNIEKENEEMLDNLQKKETFADEVMRRVR